VILLLLLALAPGVARGAELPHVAWLLDVWDVVAAEAELAEIEAAGELPPEGIYLKARLRFFQGEYEEATSLLEGVSPGNVPKVTLDRLRHAVAAVRDVTRGFVEVETPDGHFRIRHPPGPDAVLVPMLVDALPRIRQRLGKRIGVLPDHPVLIEIYPGVEDLARVTGLTDANMKDSGTIAIAKYCRLMVTSPRALLRGYDWRQTLAHEYLHLLISKRARSEVPIWLHEGIARYHEHFWSSDAAPGLKPHEETLLAAALRDGELVSFEEMSPSMALLPTQRHTMLAFSEVQTTIAFLLERSGADAVSRLLGVLGSGRSRKLDDALREVAGLSVAGFERQWRRWLKRQGLRIRKDVAPTFRRFRLSARPEDAEELDAMEKGVRDHVLLGDLLRGRNRHRAGLEEYRRAERSAGGLTRSLVRCRQASAHLALDEAEAAISVVEELPELQPGVMMAYVLLGKAHLRLGRHGEARRWLEEAVGYNPFDAAVQTALLKACQEAKDEPCAARTANALKVLRGPARPLPLQETREGP